MNEIFKCDVICYYEDVLTDIQRFNVIIHIDIFWCGMFHEQCIMDKKQFVSQNQYTICFPVEIGCQARHVFVRLSPPELGTLL